MQLIPLLQFMRSPVCPEGHYNGRLVNGRYTPVLLKPCPPEFKSKRSKLGQDLRFGGLV
jgi:hypothetical protein